MPIYEYVCGSCSHRFEVKQSMKEAPLSTCIRCGQAVTKVISAPAIMFKGSGWYVTDYSDKMKPPTDSESPAKPAEGQKDAKPDAAAATQTTSSPSPPAAGSPGEGKTPPSAAPSTPTTPSTPSSSTPAS